MIKLFPFIFPISFAIHNVVYEYRPEGQTCTVIRLDLVIEINNNRN